MKKFFVLMMVAAMSIACASVEDKAKDYQKQAADLATEITKAAAAGETEKVEELTKKSEELAKEMTDWYNSLSDEDKKKVDALNGAAEDKE